MVLQVWGCLCFHKCGICLFELLKRKLGSRLSLSVFFFLIVFLSKLRTLFGKLLWIDCHTLETFCCGLSFVHCKEKTCNVDTECAPGIISLRGK